MVARNERIFVEVHEFVDEAWNWHRYTSIETYLMSKGFRPVGAAAVAVGDRGGQVSARSIRSAERTYRQESVGVPSRLAASYRSRRHGRARLAVDAAPEGSVGTVELSGVDEVSVKGLREAIAERIGRIPSAGETTWSPALPRTYAQLRHLLGNPWVVGIGSSLFVSAVFMAVR